MSDELDELLRASVRAQAPDWLEQLVTERAVATVVNRAANRAANRAENEASSLRAASRRLRDGVAGFARSARQTISPLAQRVRAHRALASELWARVRAAVPRPHGVLLDAPAPTKSE